MKTPTLKPKTIVYDSWWPWRNGVVLRDSGRWCRVRWSDGEEWSYDGVHKRMFLRIYVRGKKKENPRSIGPK